MISIVIASYNSFKTIKYCLVALLESRNDNYDITVVDSSSDSTPTVLEEFIDDISLVRIPTRIYAGVARNHGVKKSDGEIVGFIDSDCVCDKNWVETTLKMFKDDTTMIVGGSIEPFPTQNPVSHAEYLLEFSQFFPKSPVRIIKTMPHCNIAYRRKIFEDHGTISSARMGQDSLFNKRLTDTGLRIVFCPQMKVLHIQRCNLVKFIQQQFMLGMGFVNCRQKEYYATNWAVRLKLFPLFAFGKSILILFRIILWNRKYLLVLPFLIPFMLVGLFSWTIGCYSFNPEKMNG